MSDALVAARRLYEGWIEIDDPHAEELKRMVEGRTIVSFEREPHSGDDWSHGENTVMIQLDDGSRLRFQGYGYDASSCETAYMPPSAP